MEFGEWIVQPGESELLVGTSAADIAAKKTILVRCRDPFGFSGRTSIGAIAGNLRAVEIINRNIEDDILTLAHVALEFAPDKSLEELWAGTNIQGMFGAKGWDSGRADAAYRKIFEEFEELDAC